ncbi:uncharacterized protein H6S33_011024 [Morchella sextelata]|jgi:predicted  nucleic acid-binding Zn-ribbon protein|uniref:uncharacterized protein n=1 Tax=Morchella sextelata TaxID=1174677 RepID=UPI001D04E014|nr:uncharacterized protein H6S33_011024 [Morchella sextelata]KAH0611759.1 hypothetical protein H6S33_011024 [Morchella sextelata]
MSPGKWIRRIQKQIAVLEAKQRKYERRLEALEAALPDCSTADQDATAIGIDRSNVERDKAALRERMTNAKNDIASYEGEITRIRERVARGWETGWDGMGYKPIEEWKSIDEAEEAEVV